MINPMDLTNKNVIVTGASSGIGREIAILVSKLGGKVIMIARREEKLKEVLAMLDGQGHAFYCYDLRDIEGIDEFINEIIKEEVAVDGFVHSAGIGSTRPLKMLKPKFLEEVMQVNFYSFIEITRCIAKKNNYNDGLSIVGISSVSSKQGNQCKTAYSASKAAMDAAVRCMAKELASKKIRVNSVLPALIKTKIYNDFLENGTDSNDVQNILSRQYLGIGETIDVANITAYLLSDAAKFITGACLTVDGGRLSS